MYAERIEQIETAAIATTEETLVTVRENVFNRSFSINMPPFEAIVPNRKGSDNMAGMFDTAKLADVQTVADKLAGLPRDALIYIAGYSDGRRDEKRKPRRKKKQSDNAS